MLLTFEQIVADIKNKKFYPIYILYGEEPYFVDELYNHIIENVIPAEEKDFNQNIVYGKDTNIKNIAMNAANAPMLGNHQLIVVKEAQDLKDFKKFEWYVDQYSKKTIVVFCFKDSKSIDKRISLYKKIDKIGVIFESKKLYENQIPTWIQNWLKQYNLSIKPEANRLLFEHVGSNLSNLNSELNKLKIAIKAGQTLITEDDIINNIGINPIINSFFLFI